jgi:hypothetical protein
LNHTVSSAVCGAVGADLDIILKGSDQSSHSTLKITIRNYESVVNNAPGKTLTFKMNDSTVGTAELSNGNGSAWNLRPDALADRNSACELKTAQESNEKKVTIVSLTCVGLLPNSRDLTLEERIQRKLDASLSEAVSCPIVSR